MAKVKLGLSRLSIDELVCLGTTVRGAMEGNPLFPAPTPPLATLESLGLELSDKITAYHSALGAAQTALNERDAALARFRGALAQEAAYVESVAAGDRAKIESAGMAVQRAPARRSGGCRRWPTWRSRGRSRRHARSAWEPVFGVRSYEIWSAPDPLTDAALEFRLHLPQIQRPAQRTDQRGQGLGAGAGHRGRSGTGSVERSGRQDGAVSKV